MHKPLSLPAQYQTHPDSSQLLNSPSDDTIANTASNYTLISLFIREKPVEFNDRRICSTIQQTFTPSAMPRKRRTRQHIIADLSINHVERFILRCGYSAERITYDYGTDLSISTYNAFGEIENGAIYVQVKATDSPIADLTTPTFPIVLNTKDLDFWLQEPMPFILIFYHAQEEIAYWCYLQAELSDLDLSALGNTYTVYLKKQNILNESAVRLFATYKNQVLHQIQESFRHEI